MLLAQRRRDTYTDPGEMERAMTRAYFCGWPVDLHGAPDKVKERFFEIWETVIRKEFTAGELAASPSLKNLRDGMLIEMPYLQPKRRSLWSRLLGRVPS